MRGAPRRTESESQRKREGEGGRGKSRWMVWMVPGAFWERFGRVLGAFLGPKNFRGKISTFWHETFFRGKREDARTGATSPQTSVAGALLAEAPRSCTSTRQLTICDLVDFVKEHDKRHCPLANALAPPPRPPPRRCSRWIASSAPVSSRWGASAQMFRTQFERA